MHQHTRVRVGCALWVGEEILVHVDPQSVKNDESEPAVWSFGGVIRCTNKDRADLEKDFGAERFEGDLCRRDDHPYDLSCWVLLRSQHKFKGWLDKRQFDQPELPALPIIDTAQAEINEEFRDFGLPSHLADAVQYGEFERFDYPGLIHTYTGKESKGAMCYTYVVQCSVDRKAERKIRDLVECSESLYLITLADVERGHIQGAVKGKPKEILVPEVLGLLFR